MTPEEHRATAEGFCTAAAANLADRPDVAGVQASLANTHARLAALMPREPIRERPSCDETAVSGERCALQPGHVEPHRMVEQ